MACQESNASKRGGRGGGYSVGWGGTAKRGGIRDREKIRERDGEREEKQNGTGKWPVQGNDLVYIFQVTNHKENREAEESGNRKII